MRLRTKFTLYLLIVGLLPLLILGGYSFVRVETIVRQTKELALLSLGMEVGNQIRRLIREGYSSVLQLSENQLVRSQTTSRWELKEELTKTQRYHPIILDLTVVGIDGVIKGSVFYSFRGDWRSTSWYNAALSGDPMLSEVHAILYPFHVVMTVAVPNKDENGTIQDILFGQLDMDPISEVLQGIDLGPGGRAVLVDERGIVVGSGLKEEILEPFAFAPVLTGVARQPVRFRHEGRDWVGIGVPIDETGEIVSPQWRLLLIQPVEHAYQAAYSVRTGLTIAGMCSLVTIMILSSLFSRHIGRRIGSLTRAAKGLGAGQFDVRLQRVGKDEIGELGGIFNWAGEQLALSRDKIRRYQEDLEHLVQERTSELSRANKVLLQEIEERKRSEEERRNLEEQLRQAQKMEALGTLAGGIAHDFNNLLQAMAGIVQLLLLNNKTAGNEDRVHLLELDRVAARATDLVRRLLAFSRKMDSAPRRMVLNEAVHNVIELLQRTIPKSIVLREELDPELGEIRADQTQMEQVLINLAGNAVDAMPRGGTLTFRTERVPAAAVGEPLIRLTVCDTGNGMEEDVLAHIFEPFYTTKPIGKGTGLGLSTVYGIVKEHGGAVNCTTRPGQGTCFEILLPGATGVDEDAAHETVQEKDILGGIETVLVVDDEEVIRDVAEDVLGRQGYTVIQAESGEQALEILKNNGRVDLVITDLGMPGMGGEQLLKELETMPDRPKVIVSSGYATHPLFDGEGGRYVVLRKPYRLSEMLRKVREVLDHPAL
jgi:signal transduction histidine kinase/CheY-like chemotaxis protein